MSKTFTKDEVENLISIALNLNAMQPIYNVRINEYGELDYLVCIPHVHVLVNRETKERFDVTASDDGVVVAVSQKTGVTKIIYQSNLPSYEVVNKDGWVTEANALPQDADLPDIGGVFTHNNGNSYLVFGLGNLNALPQNRGKYPIMVLYIGANGNIWAKPVEDFLRSAVRGGTFRFKEGVKMEYMGISDNDSLENGFMTREVQALMQSAGTPT